MNPIKNPLNKNEMTQLKELLKNKAYLIQRILEQWNEKRPHFGGNGPHRYDGNEKLCGYCLRPKNWKYHNAGWYASIISENLKKKRGAK